MALAVEGNSVNQLYPKSLSGFVGKNVCVSMPSLYSLLFGDVSVKEQFAWDSVRGRHIYDIHIAAQSWILMLEHR